MGYGISSTHFGLFINDLANEVNTHINDLANEANTCGKRLKLRKDLIIALLLDGDYLAVFADS